MPRYRSRPAEITAEQFHGRDIPDPVGVCRCDDGFGPHVHTIHGGQVAELTHGDYVVAEPDGIHYYPVKPDIFEKRWELIS